ncbi:MAG: NAD(P)H-binding protein [Anaerolineaceae bacterium]|nr:NAD(P)H-binding protein [Anaerolineaceae bacterium]
MVKRILVIGATGFLGEPVARKLKEDGYTIRIMARNEEKAQEKFADGFEIIQGDANVIDDVKSALKDCMGVHCTIAGDAELTAVQNVIAAADGTKLDRVTYISGCTAVEENRWFPLIETKLQAEAALQASGIPYTIFAPSWPMEMLVRYARNGLPTLIGKQTNAFHFFSLDDLARMVSTAYQVDQAINKRFVIHGPQAIPFDEALMHYCKVFHPEVAKVSKLPVWLAMLIARLTKNELMRFGAELSGYFDKVGELGDPAQANALLGTPSITLDEWISKRETSVS